MTPAVANILLRSNFNPYRLPGIAARYDASDLASLSYDGSNRVGLLSDKSGNSRVNALVLTGSAVGNYASAPDSPAVSVTGPIDINIKAQLTTWTPGNDHGFVTKLATVGQYSYDFMSHGVTRRLRFRKSVDGSVLLIATADAAVPFVDNQLAYVKVTHDTLTGDTKFYTSTDGVAWTQLGTTQVISTGSIFDGNTDLLVGAFAPATGLFSGNIHRAQIRNGIDGTIVFDADFTQVPKLATSFTESSANAATVTINTSGDLGARISGARDLYQFTSGKQGILTLSPSGNYITTDGLNDFWKAAPFPLTQPTTVYFVGSQVSWSSGLTIFDGGGASSLRVYQSTTSDNFRLTTDGTVTNTDLNADWATGVRAVVSALANGTTSSTRVNRRPLVGGSAGTGNANGFTLSSRSDGVAPANITVSEVLIFSAAHDAATQLKVAQFLMRKHRIG